MVDPTSIVCSCAFQRPVFAILFERPLRDALPALTPSSVSPLQRCERSTPSTLLAFLSSKPASGIDLVSLPLLHGVFPPSRQTPGRCAPALRSVLLIQKAWCFGIGRSCYCEPSTQRPKTKPRLGWQYSRPRRDFASSSERTVHGWDTVAHVSARREEIDLDHLGARLRMCNDPQCDSPRIWLQSMPSPWGCSAQSRAPIEWVSPSSRCVGKWLSTPQKDRFP